MSLIISCLLNSVEKPASGQTTIVSFMAMHSEPTLRQRTPQKGLSFGEVRTSRQPFAPRCCLHWLMLCTTLASPCFGSAPRTGKPQDAAAASTRPSDQVLIDCKQATESLRNGDFDAASRALEDRKSTRLNPVTLESRMPSSA